MRLLTLIAVFGLMTTSNAHACLFGCDLPLLAEIVANTLDTLHELQAQTAIFNDEMAGIRDKIDRIQTVAQVVQPSHWNEWKDPAEALRRLQVIYYTLPKEYRSEKSDVIETEISQAMNMVSRLSEGASSSFLSGKELERRGADASPGVAQKLTASGVGSMVTLQAQSQVIESHITSLLAQMLANSNEREARSVASHGAAFSGVSRSLGSDDNRFSILALDVGAGR